MAEGSEKSPHRQRRRSYEVLPPDLSELRLVLLGNSRPGICSVGNLLLGETVFSDSTRSDCCMKTSGTYEMKNMVLINTPDLLDPRLSDTSRSELIKECVELSSPGPHAFILVLQPEDFTEHQRIRLQWILENFSDQAFQHTLVLLLMLKHKSADSLFEMYRKKPPLWDIIKQCRFRYLRQKDLEPLELISRLGQIVMENGGEYVRPGISVGDLTPKRDWPANFHSQTEGKEKSHYRQRRSSYEDIRPDMSELNVVLLGNSWRLKSSVVNLLLKQTELKAMRETPNCKTYKGEMNGQPLTVVNTADLQHTNRDEFINDIKALNGPLVFLLVLQPEAFTEEHKYKIYSLLLSFSEKAFDRSLVLISTEQAETTGFLKRLMNPAPYKWDQNRHIKDMIILCKNKYLCIKNTEDDLKLRRFQREELFTRIRQMLEKTEENLSYGPSQEELTEKKPPLTLVLCGRAGAEKTSVIKAMLEEDSAAVSSGQRVKHQGEVCGRWLSLVELPPLYDKSEEEVMEQCLSCLSLCAPQGVQAFILVLPLGPVTDEDKEEMKIIQDTFSSAVKPFTKILFTVDSHAAPDVVPTELQELSQSCGGGYLIFNTRGQQQVSELLESVETLMTKNKPHSFTKDTLIYGQRRTIMDQPQLVQGLKNRRTVSGSETSADCLRIAVVGKTGCGKSSSGNTILGRKVFNARGSFRSVTSSCGKAEAEVDGRRVVVVDTPGLFDNTMSEDEIIEETSKCVGLLAPGPHVFLLVIPIGRFTKEEKEAVDIIKKGFGNESQKYTMILFTHGDNLDEASIEESIEGDRSLVKLLSDCGHRYHVFNNREESNRSQVSELIKKIDAMVQQNGGDCYTNDMFQNAEATIRKEMERIMKEKEEEIERKYQQEINEIKEEMEKQKEQTEKEKERRERELRAKEEEIKKEKELREDKMDRIMMEKEEEKKARDEMERKYQQEIEEIKQEMEKQKVKEKNEIKWREEELRKKEEEIYKEEKQRKKEQEKKDKEERKRRDQEELKRQDWERKRKDLEEKIQLESESKEAIDQNLQRKLRESKDKLDKEREEWEHERIKWWINQKEERKEEERKKKEQEERQRQEFQQIRKALEEKIKSESEARQAIDKKLQRKLQESRDKMAKEREEWENERKEWWQRREQENEEGQRKLKQLQEEYDRKIQEHQAQQQRQDTIRKKQEEGKMNEIKDRHEKELEDLMIHSIGVTRKEAEKEYQKKEKERMEENRKNVTALVKRICYSQVNVNKINKKLQEHEKQMRAETDVQKKEKLLKDQDKELSELIQTMMDKMESRCKIL